MHYLCGLMVYLTRVEHFNAAHKLYNPGWSRERNEEVFGKCANENWHGHNYDLYVTIKGEPDPDTGFFVRRKAVERDHSGARHREAGPQEPEYRGRLHAGEDVLHGEPGGGDLAAAGASYPFRGPTAWDKAV